MKDKIVHQLLKHPKKALALAMLLTFALGFGVTKLKSNYNTKSWFHKDDPGLIKLEEFEKKFGGDDFYLLYIKSPQNFISETAFKMLNELEEAFMAIPEVREFQSIKNVPLMSSDEEEIRIELIEPQGLGQEEIKKLRSLIQEEKGITGYLIDKEQKTLLSNIKLKNFTDSDPDYKRITQDIKDVLEKFRHNYPNLEFRLSGQLAIQDAFAQISSKDLKVVGPIASFLILIFLYLSFKSLTIALVPILMCIMVITSTLGFASYIDITFNNLLSLLPGIILAICCADIIHIFKAKQKFMGQDNANFMALRSEFTPTLLTSVTTAIGFLSFTVSKVAPTKSLGILTVFGVLYAWLICFLITPYLLKKLELKKSKSFLDKNFKSLSFIHNNRKLIWLSFISITIFSTIFFMKVNIESRPYNFFDKKLPIYQANQAVREAFGGNKGPVITLESQNINSPDFLKKVQELEDFLYNEVNVVVKVSSVLDIIKKLNYLYMGSKEGEYRIPDSQEAISQLLFAYEFSNEAVQDLRRKVDISNTTITLDLLWSINSSKEAKHYNQVINKKIKELGLTGQTNGKNPLFTLLNDYVIETVLLSIFTTSIFISILLFILFRNFKISIISIIPNILPILIGGAVAYFAGIDIDVATALVASICMGIAVDDTIHFLYHYQGNLKKKVKQPILNTINSTYSALSWTTMILILGFGSFCFGKFTPNVNFGILCAVVLSFALATDLILLPSLLTGKETED